MLDTMYHQALFEVTGVARMPENLLAREFLSSCTSSRQCVAVMSSRRIVQFHFGENAFVRMSSAQR